MANNSKKYASLATLQTFLANLKNTFATLSHKHKISDLTDYTVDTTLSSTSNNPIANKTVDAEFEAVSQAMNALDAAIDTKADAAHNHDSAYAAKTHNHDGVYATASHNHDSKYDSKGSSAAVQENLDTVSDTLDAHTTNTDIHVTTTNKSNWNSAYTHSTSAHARTDATKVEDSTTNGNIKINGTETNVYSHPNSGVTAGTYKSVTVNAQGHITTGSNPTTLSGYGITDAETKTDASKKLTEAKTYADNVAAQVKNDLLNGAGGAYDTLKELGDLIDDNADAIDALETVAAGKANATHSHAISDVTNLQSTLDGKANSSHGTHVSYSTTAPVMDGTASVGTASTVARSDHKHPTDTSRASKTEFDTHVSDTTAHMTSTQKTQLSTAYNHSQAAHAPSNAQANQNAFSNIAVSGQTTVSADTTTDTLTLAGSNVTITTDATNDKITFSVANGTTSAKGVVQLTNSTSSTSTTTAATPNSVKSAYDLANQAKTAAATAQTTADGKANASHTHTVANITDLTATATELNYMDGVTSNVQTQLDKKQATVTGAASTITGSNLTANRALISNGSGKVANSSVTSTELGYLSGATSGIQTQLNDKAKVTYKSYSAFGTASTGTDGWYTLFTLNDSTSGSALCLLKGYAHSSVVFTVTKGYAANATLNVLDYNGSSNGSYAYIKALRILSDGKVQAQIHTGTVNISIHVVSADGTLTPVSSLVCDTAANPEICVSRTLSAGKMIAGGFVGDLSGNATSATKATQDGSGNVITSTYETKTAASAKLTEAKTYTDSVASGKANSSHNHAASNITSGTLSSDRLPTVPIAKGGTGATTAAAALTNLGITATAAELNKLDGVTATTAELNYVDGVTSNIQTQLDGKAASSHGTHVTWATSAPKANGTAAVGTVARVAREDHVHPLQTTVSGNAGSATTISKRIRITSSQSANAGKYIKFGTATLPNAYSSFTGYLIFNPTESNAGASGILHLHIRNGANNTSTSCTMKWIDLENAKYEKTVSAVKVSDGVFDFYYKPINTWDTMEIIAIAGDGHNTLTLANSGTYVDSITATYTSSVGGYVASVKNAIPVATTAGTGAAYTATIDGITELTDGLRITIIPHTAATTIYCTLNVNGLGAKNVFRRRFDNSSRVYQGSAMWLMSGTPISLTYSTMFGCWMSDLNAANADDIQGLVPVRTGGTGTGSFTKDYFLVGNGTSAIVAKSPSDVMSMIGAASVSAISTAEYEELEATGTTNANTLYMLTDAEDEEEVLITTDDIDAICGVTV